MAAKLWSKSNIISLLYRAWQKKLHSLLQDSDHKAEIYKYLWMLVVEADPEVFQEKMATFVTFWEVSEPKFITYFKDYYANRVGM